MHGEVVHFEIPAKEVRRAKAFYSQVFGWKMNDTMMPGGDTYTSLMTTETDPSGMRPKNPGAINGGMMQLREPFSGPVVTIQVNDVTSALKSIEENGGKAIMPRTDIGQFGAIGYFKDTEGNLIGLFEVPKM